MKVYETRYNGHRPYCVEVSDHEIEVFEQSWDETNEYWSKNRRVYHSPYERIFIGDNDHHVPSAALKGAYPGNTILVHVQESEYVFIGHSLFRFRTYNDAIQSYSSTMTNELSIPCATATGSHHTYDMTRCLYTTEKNDPSPFMITILHTWMES